MREERERERRWRLTEKTAVVFDVFYLTESRKTVRSEPGVVVVRSTLSL